MYRPATLLDRLRADRAAGRHGPTPPATGAGPLVRCGCGRQQSADMMTDVSALDPALRVTLQLPEGLACDACCERPVLTRRIGRVALLEALGAPAAARGALEAYARAHDGANVDPHRQPRAGPRAG